jgi:hypothetical protein
MQGRDNWHDEKTHKNKNINHQQFDLSRAPDQQSRRFSSLWWKLLFRVARPTDLIGIAVAAVAAQAASARHSVLADAAAAATVFAVGQLVDALAAAAVQSEGAAVTAGAAHVVVVAADIKA